MSMPANNQQGLNTIISKAHAKDKVMDIRDGLWLPKNYGEVTDGGIPIYICDFTKGTGDRSTTVKANLEPFRFKILKEIVAKNTGILTTPVNGVFGEAIMSIYKLYYLVGGLISQTKRLIEEMGSGKTVLAEPKDKLRAIFKILRDAQQMSEAAQFTNPIQFIRSYDYSYKQERVNPHKEKDGGFCPVSVVQINRNGFYKGEPSNYPWYIKVTNFDARKRTTRERSAMILPPRQTSVKPSSTSLMTICSDFAMIVSRSWIFGPVQTQCSSFAMQ